MFQAPSQLSKLFLQFIDNIRENILNDGNIYFPVIIYYFHINKRCARVHARASSLYNNK